MKTQQSKRWLLGAITGVLVLGVVFSYTQWAGAKHQADRARSERDAVAGLLVQLDALGGRPELAADQSEHSEQLTRHIETVASQVGIAANQIDRVQSQPARRIDDGPYLRQPTQVQLHQVTLRELLALLHDLDTDGRTLQLDDLRLIAPHNQLVGPRWRAEFTVSHLIYQPAETSDRASR